MRIFFHFIGIVSLCTFSYSQNFDAHWHLGTATTIDFRQGLPIVSNSSSIDTEEGCSSISDPVTGELLFYTDGLTVYDSSHQAMPNGTGLLGHLSATQCYILPWPERENHYLIFTNDAAENYFWNGSGNGLRWSVVDMSLNQGKGDVTLKNQLLLDPAGERIAITRHSNGVDAWLLTHPWNSAEFHAYRITCGGIDSLPAVSTVGPYQGGQGTAALDMIGFMKVSTDGRQLAISRKGANQVEVYDFDPEMGMVSNPTLLANVPQPFGLEFSPSGRFLYMTWFHFSISYLGQVDLQAGAPNAILASMDTLAVGGNQYGLLTSLQIGPDHRIYVARRFKNYLSVIKQPDLPGAACQFTAQGLSLGQGICRTGLPNSCNLWPDPDRDRLAFAVQGDCVGSPVRFEDASDYIPDSTLWVVSDPAGGALFTSRLPEPELSITQAGTYLMTRIDYRGCRSDTLTQSFQLFGFLADLGPDVDRCEGDSVKIAGGPPGFLYQWSDGNNGPEINIDQSGQYILTVSEGNCIDRDTLMVNFYPTFELDLGEDETWCKGASIALTGPANLSTQLWSDGSVQDTLWVSEEGTYWLEASDGVCKVKDSIHCSFIEPPMPALPHEMMLCEGEELWLQADPDGRFPLGDFVWNNGETEAAIKVAEPGEYRVEISIGQCNAQGAVKLLEVGRIPPMDWTESQILCPGQSINLSVDTTTANRLWPDGSQGSHFEVSAPGMLVMQSFNKCHYRLDSLMVREGTLPQVELGMDQIVCGGGSTMLEARLDGGGIPWQLQWSTGESNRSIQVDETGLYKVELSNACGVAKDEVQVTINTDGGMNIPNVFTPNGDGINDEFRPALLRGDDYLLRIQDRWGVLVFQTENPESGWNGRFKGQTLQEGSYFYSVRFRDCQGALQEKAGSLSLLR